MYVSAIFKRLSKENSQPKKIPPKAANAQSKYALSVIGASILDRSVVVASATPVPGILYVARGVSVCVNQAEDVILVVDYETMMRGRSCCCWEKEVGCFGGLKSMMRYDIEGAHPEKDLASAR